jgi:hypothetical protein
MAPLSRADFRDTTKGKLCKTVKNLKNRQFCGIDPIVGIVGTFGKNSLDRLSPQETEFPVVNLDRKSAFKHSKGSTRVCNNLGSA